MSCDQSGRNHFRGKQMGQMTFLWENLPGFSCTGKLSGDKFPYADMFSRPNLRLLFHES